MTFHHFRTEFKSFLGVPVNDKLGFQSHTDTAAKSSSNVANKFTC